MGIGIPIHVLGLTQLTEGTTDGRKDCVYTLLRSYDARKILSREDYEQIMASTTKAGTDAKCADVISYAERELAAERAFFQHLMQDSKATGQDATVQYAVAFERDPKRLQSCLRPALEEQAAGQSPREALKQFVRRLVEFVLKDLSTIIIAYIDETALRLYKSNAEKVKLLNFIVKMHKMYSRLPAAAIEKVTLLTLPCLAEERELTLADCVFASSVAYRVYVNAGSYLLLEQRYQNPVEPILPGHLVEQQKLLAKLPFWTFDAQAVFAYLNQHRAKGDIASAGLHEVLQLLFWENKELGQRFILAFTEGEHFRYDAFMLSCMSCCLDPRDTLNDCLWNYLTSANADGKHPPTHAILHDAVKCVLDFATRKLSRLILSSYSGQESKLGLSHSFIAKLAEATDIELETVLSTLLPNSPKDKVITNADIQFGGDDCLVLRLIDQTATVLKMRGKYLEHESDQVPLHLLACRAFIQGLTFANDDALAVVSRFESLKVADGLDVSEDLIGTIATESFISYFMQTNTRCLNIKAMTTAAMSLCLDIHNTLQDCMWKLLKCGDSVRQQDVHSLAMQMAHFLVVGVAKIMLPQLQQGLTLGITAKRLCYIQEKYIAITQAQLEHVVSNVMPFVKLPTVKKTDIESKLQDQRFAYAILTQAADILHLDDPFIP